MPELMSWEELSSNERFAKLPYDTRVKVADRYFKQTMEGVAVPPETRELAKTKFMSKVEKPITRGISETAKEFWHGGLIGLITGSAKEPETIEVKPGEENYYAGRIDMDKVRALAEAPPKPSIIQRATKWLGDAIGVDVPKGQEWLRERVPAYVSPSVFDTPGKRAAIDAYKTAFGFIRAATANLTDIIFGAPPEPPGSTAGKMATGAAELAGMFKGIPGAAATRTANIVANPALASSVKAAIGRQVARDVAFVGTISGVAGVVPAMEEGTSPEEVIQRVNRDVVSGASIGLIFGGSRLIDSVKYPTIAGAARIGTAVALTKMVRGEAPWDFSNLQQDASDIALNTLVLWHGFGPKRVAKMLNVVGEHTGRGNTEVLGDIHNIASDEGNPIGNVLQEEHGKAELLGKVKGSLKKIMATKGETEASDATIQEAAQAAGITDPELIRKILGIEIKPEPSREAEVSARAISKGLGVEETKAAVSKITEAEERARPGAAAVASTAFEGSAFRAMETDALIKHSRQLGASYLKQVESSLKMAEAVREGGLSEQERFRRQENIEQSRRQLDFTQREMSLVEEELARREATPPAASEAGGAPEAVAKAPTAVEGAEKLREPISIDVKKAEDLARAASTAVPPHERGAGGGPTIGYDEVDMLKNIFSGESQKDLHDAVVGDIANKGVFAATDELNNGNEVKAREIIEKTKNHLNNIATIDPTLAKAVENHNGKIVDAENKIARAEEVRPSGEEGKAAQRKGRLPKEIGKKGDREPIPSSTTKEAETVLAKVPDLLGEGEKPSKWFRDFLREPMEGTVEDILEFPSGYFGERAKRPLSELVSEKQRAKREAGIKGVEEAIVKENVPTTPKTKFVDYARGAVAGGEVKSAGTTNATELRDSIATKYFQSKGAPDDFIEKWLKKDEAFKDKQFEQLIKKHESFPKWEEEAKKELAGGEDLDKAIKEVKGRLSKKTKGKSILGSESGGGYKPELDTESLKDLADLGYLYFQKGTKTFDNWAKAFTEGFSKEEGTFLNPHLKDIYNTVRKMQESAAKTGVAIQMLDEKKMAKEKLGRTGPTLESSIQVAFSSGKLKKMATDSDLLVKDYNPKNINELPTLDRIDLGRTIPVIKGSDKYWRSMTEGGRTPSISLFPRVFTELYGPHIDAQIKLGEMSNRIARETKWSRLFKQVFPSIKRELRDPLEKLNDSWRDLHQTIKQNGWSLELDRLEDAKLDAKAAGDNAGAKRIQDLINEHPSKEVRKQIKAIEKKAYNILYEKALNSPAIRVAWKAEGRITPELEERMSPIEKHFAEALRKYFDYKKGEMEEVKLPTIERNYIRHLVNPWLKSGPREANLDFDYFDYTMRYPHRKGDFNWMPDPMSMLEGYIGDVNRRISLQDFMNKWNDDVIRELAVTHPKTASYLNEWKKSNIQGTSSPFMTAVDLMIEAEYMKDLFFAVSTGVRHVLKFTGTTARQGVLDTISTAFHNFLEAPVDALHKVGVADEDTFRSAVRRSFGIDAKTITSMLLDNPTIRNKVMRISSRAVTSPVGFIESFEHTATAISEVLRGEAQGLPADIIRREVYNSLLRTNFRSGFDQQTMNKMAGIKAFTMYKMSTVAKIGENFLSNLRRAALAGKGETVRLVKDTSTDTLIPAYRRGSRMEVVRFLAIAGAIEAIARKHDTGVFHHILAFPWFNELIEPKHGFPYYTIHPERLKTMQEFPIARTAVGLTEHGYRVLTGDEEPSEGAEEVLRVNAGGIGKYLKMYQRDIPEGYKDELHYLLGLKELEEE